MVDHHVIPFGHLIFASFFLCFFRIVLPRCSFCVAQDAFGVMGVEGPFRRACEVTMSVVRDHRDLLFNVLQSFVNDPLVEWEKTAPAASSAAAVGSAVSLGLPTTERNAADLAEAE